MVVSCWVRGCTNRGDGTRSFHYIPKVREFEGEKTKEMSEERRRVWLANINRKEEPSKTSRICSDHFVSGKPADLYDRSNPDWAPTLNLSDTCTQRKSAKKIQKTDTDLKSQFNAQKIIMGEMYQYPITMLVTSEQEFAIRTMFDDRNWTCLLNVISEESLNNLRQSGFAHIFPGSQNYQDVEIDGQAYREIKTEVVDVDKHDADNTFDRPVKPVNIGVFPSSSTPESGSITSLSSGTASKSLSGIHSGFVSPKNVKRPRPYKRRSTAIPKTDHAMSENSGRIASSFITGSGLFVSDACGVPASGYLATDAATSFSSFNFPATVVNSGKETSVDRSSQTDQKLFKGETSSEDTDNNKMNEDDSDDENDDVDNDDDYNDDYDDDTDDYMDHDESMVTDKAKTNDKTEELLLEDQAKQPYNGAFNYVLCVDCPSRFFTWEDLWKHRNEANHELPKVRPHGWSKRNFSPEELEKMGYLICNACNSYFPDRRKLRQHYYAIHRELMPSPSCPICGEEFLSHKELHKHKREKQHNDSVWLLGSYQCDTCGKRMRKYENFRRHKLLSCGKSEAELEALYIHPCEICGKRFKTVKAVKVHMDVVHDNTESVCEICGKVCKSKFALRGHRRRHNEKNRKYVCDDCGKAFFTSSLLQQHIRTHTKEKPFKCPLCEYTCSVRENVHKHARNVHKEHITAVDLRKSNSLNP